MDGIRAMQEQLPWDAEASPASDEHPPRQQSPDIDAEADRNQRYQHPPRQFTLAAQWSKPMNTPIIINPQRSASFDVDAQNSFTPLSPDELPVAEGHCIAGELNRQAAFASLRIGSKDAHSPAAVWVSNEQHPPLSPVKGHANADLHWPLHAVPGTHGFALLDELPAVTDYDFFVWKGIEPTLHPYGACFHDLANQLSTGVIEFLQARDIDTVLVGGLATDYCVLNTVLQLRNAVCP